MQEIVDSSYLSIVGIVSQGILFELKKKERDFYITLSFHLYAVSNEQKEKTSQIDLDILGNLVMERGEEVWGAERKGKGLRK